MKRFATERDARASAFLDAAAGRRAYVVRGVDLFYVCNDDEVPRDLTGALSADVVAVFASASELDLKPRGV